MIKHFIFILLFLFNYASLVKAVLAVTFWFQAERVKFIESPPEEMMMSMTVG